mmetsp:Transcript_28503/g.52630  ORF Transcript_28503/g.52630 Transcript_28503/m.52630 type:complete len:143 (+) Transcript_28503:56-484(+)
MPKKVSPKFKEKQGSALKFSSSQQEASPSLLARPGIAAGIARSIRRAQSPLKLPLTTSKLGCPRRTLIRRGERITHPLSSAHGLVAGPVARFRIVRNGKVGAVAQVALRGARGFRPGCGGASAVGTAVVEEAGEGCYLVVAV